MAKQKISKMNGLFEKICLLSPIGNIPNSQCCSIYIQLPNNQDDTILK